MTSLEKNCFSCPYNSRILNGEEPRNCDFNCEYIPKENLRVLGLNNQENGERKYRERNPCVLEEALLAILSSGEKLENYKVQGKINDYLQNTIGNYSNNSRNGGKKGFLGIFLSIF